MNVASVLQALAVVAVLAFTAAASGTPVGSTGTRSERGSEVAVEGTVTLYAYVPAAVPATILAPTV